VRDHVRVRAGVILAMTAAAVGLLAGSAAAQLSLTPTMKGLQVRVNTTRSYQIGVTNGSSRALSCTMRVQPAGMTEDGRPVTLKEGARSAASWTTTKPAQFTLSPGQGRNVEVTVKPPAGASGGYSAIVSVSVPPGGGVRGRGSAVELGFLVSHVLVVTVPGPSMRVKAEASDVRMSRDNDGRLRVSAKLSNAGDLHLWSSGNAAVLGRTGRAVSQAAFETRTGLVLPGSHRVFQAVLPGRLGDGIYTVRADFFAGGRRLAGATQTVTLIKGNVTAGRPTPEQEAALLAGLPRFDISRGRAHYDLAPGGQRADSVVIRNVTNKTIEVIPELMFWDLDENADLYFGTKDSRHGRAGMQFVTYSPQRLKLAPGRLVRVNYTVKVPRGAAGEYYPALVFHEQGRPLPKDPLLIRQHALVLSLAAKGTCERQTKVAVAGFKRDAAGGGTLQVTVSCVGNAGVEIEGTARITGAGGKAVGQPQKFGGEGVVLLPKSQATFKVSFPYRMEKGRYTANVTVTQVGTKNTIGSANHQFEVGG